MALTANEISSLKTGIDPATGKELTSKQLMAIQAKATDAEIQELLGIRTTGSVVSQAEVKDLPNKLANSGQQQTAGFTLEKTGKSSDAKVTSLVVEQLKSKKDVNGANGVFLGDSHGNLNISEYVEKSMPEYKKQV